MLKYFTGTVRIDPLFEAPDPHECQKPSSPLNRAHGLPDIPTRLRQTLIVMTGSGRTQRWGGPIEDIRPGDVIWFEPGEKLWKTIPKRGLFAVLLKSQDDLCEIVLFSLLQETQPLAPVLEWSPMQHAFALLCQGHCSLFLKGN